MSSSVNIPDFKLTWNGKATDDLKGQVAAIVFDDYEHGKSDSCEIVFQDAEKLWKGDWYPVRGDTIKLEMGYKDQTLMNCGLFSIDELETHILPPSTLVVRARSAFPKKAFFQKNTVAYEDTTLSAVLSTIAGHHGMQHEYKGARISFKTLVQRRESDNAFLKRVAERYGFIFKITDEKMILYAREDIEKRREVAELQEGDNHRIFLRETSTGEVKKTKSVWYNQPKDNILESTETSAYKPVATDEQRLYDRLEDNAQSKRVADAARRRSDYSRVVGRIIVRDHQTVMLAGVTVRLKGYKNFDGLYFVESAHHVMRGRTYYETELTVKRVAK